ncbi:MAG: OadG family protein [Clostridia bacterium]|nr:OadG family protein [Clostridia bacterium]
MTTVVFVGLFIVFLGLICLIAIVAMMGKLCKALIPNESEAQAPTQATSPVANPASSQAAQPIPNRDELVVAFSAAVAEELGTDVSAIRVVSLKEIK